MPAIDSLRMLYRRIERNNRTELEILTDNGWRFLSRFDQTRDDKRRLARAESKLAALGYREQR